MYPLEGQTFFLFSFLRRRNCENWIQKSQPCQIRDALFPKICILPECTIPISSCVLECTIYSHRKIGSFMFCQVCRVPNQPPRRRHLQPPRCQAVPPHAKQDVPPLPLRWARVARGTLPCRPRLAADGAVPRDGALARAGALTPHHAPACSRSRTRV